MREILLPFCNARRKDYIDTLVIHASAQNTVDALIGVLVERELSAHYVIGGDGEVIRLVPDEMRAWHAGAGEWRGEREINSNSIGIELCNGLFGEESYGVRQIEALTELCLHLIDKYDFKPQNIIGHSDMAPTRKIDPGTCFRWRELAKHGIGLWYDKEEGVSLKSLNPTEALQKIGYPTDDLAASEWAFLRHYNPELYYFLGGKKGMNAGKAAGVMPHDNPGYLKTLASVAAAFERADAKDAARDGFFKSIKAKLQFGRG